MKVGIQKNITGVIVSPEEGRPFYLWANNVTVLADKFARDKTEKRSAAALYKHIKTALEGAGHEVVEQSEADARAEPEPDADLYIITESDGEGGYPILAVRGEKHAAEIVHKLTEAHREMCRIIGTRGHYLFYDSWGVPLEQ